MTIFFQKRVIGLTVLLVFGFSSLIAPQEVPDPKLWAEAVRLTRSCLVIDAHSDVTSRLLKRDFDFNERHSDGHVDLPRMKEGGLSAEFFAVFTPPGTPAAASMSQALAALKAIHRAVDRGAGQMAVVRSSRDLEVNFQKEQHALFDQHPIPPLSVEVLVDHIDHVVKVAGIDHVGLGSDFDGISELPAPLKGCQDIPIITYTLLKRGYNREQIEKVLGKNLLRFYKAVEASAHRK